MPDCGGHVGHPKMVMVFKNEGMKKEYWVCARHIRLPDRVLLAQFISTNPGSADGKIKVEKYIQGRSKMMPFVPSTCTICGGLAFETEPGRHHCTRCNKTAVERWAM